MIATPAPTASPSGFCCFVPRFPFAYIWLGKSGSAPGSFELFAPIASSESPGFVRHSKALALYPGLKSVGGGGGGVSARTVCGGDGGAALKQAATTQGSGGIGEDRITSEGSVTQLLPTGPRSDQPPIVYLTVQESPLGTMELAGGLYCQR